MANRKGDYIVELIRNLDITVLEFIRMHMNTEFLDNLMPYITALGNGGLIWIGIALAFLLSKQHRMDGLLIIFTLLICVLIGNVILKPFIGRIRPFDINTAIELLIPRPMDFSFPSGHTMSSFAVATILFYVNHNMGVVAFVVAFLIAFSRLYLYVHYPSDIIGGIVIGVLIAMLTINLYEMIMANHSTYFKR